MTRALRVRSLWGSGARARELMRRAQMDSLRSTTSRSTRMPNSLLDSRPRTTGSDRDSTLVPTCVPLRFPFPTERQLILERDTQFDNLDENVQAEFEAYLEERGINSSLALFIPDICEYKEQK